MQYQNDRFFQITAVILLTVFVLTACSDTSQNFESEITLSKILPGEFQSYSWAPFKLYREGDSVSFSDYHIETTRRVKYKYNDSTLFLLAFDTLPFEVRLIPEKSEELTHNVQIQAKANPNYNADWKNQPLGTRPTPLTQNQASAFKAFSNFRMLDQPIPDFELTYALGGFCTPDVFNGKVTVLNFWYTSCLPCVAEIPALNALKEQYADDPTVQFISFFADSILVDNNDQLLFTRPRGYTDGGAPKPKHIDFSFEQVMNTISVHKEFNVLSYPTNLVIDEQGIIQHISLGAAVEGNNDVLRCELDEAIQRLRHSDHKELR